MAFGGKTFGSKTFAGYGPTATPTIPPTADQIAVSYFYENVGLSVVGVDDIEGVAYLYEDVNAIGYVSWVVGRVRARLDDSYGVAYLYENVT